MYKIFLRNDKTRLYDRFAILIFILNGIALLSAIVYAGPGAPTNDFKTFWLALAAIVMIAPVMAVRKNETKRAKQLIIYFTIPAMLFWVFVEFWWLAVVLGILVLLYLQTKKELAVSIEAKKIIYPSFPERKINWQDLENLILKDQLLTIDFKNDKLIQQPIDPKSYRINEQEFNDFCKRQIMLASS